MTRLAAILLVAGCATPTQTPDVIVEPDPLSGASTAYATVFLANDGTRLVVSAPVGEAAPVAVTLWMAADRVQSSCDAPTLTIDGHEIRPDSVEARVLATPSGSDQTLAFRLPPAVFASSIEKPTEVAACGGKWPFDDEDRATLRAFREVVGTR